MIRKILVLLLVLGVISSVIIFPSRQSAETIKIGNYEALASNDVKIKECNIMVVGSPDNKIHAQLRGHNLHNNSIKMAEENKTLFFKEQQQKKNLFHFYINTKTKSDMEIKLPNLNKETNHIGDVANMLSVETVDGSIY